MTDDDTIPACPECDTTTLTQSVRTDAWNCRECPWSGPAPTWRQRHHPGGHRVGLAGVLEDLDPDDVGGSA